MRGITINPVIIFALCQPFISFFSPVLLQPASGHHCIFFQFFLATLFLGCNCSKYQASLCILGEPGQPICHGGHFDALSSMTLHAALSALSPSGMYTVLPTAALLCLYQKTKNLCLIQMCKTLNKRTLLCSDVRLGDCSAKHRNGAVRGEVRHEAQQLGGGQADRCRH